MFEPCKAPVASEIQTLLALIVGVLNKLSI